MRQLLLAATLHRMGAAPVCPAPLVSSLHESSAPVRLVVTHVPRLTQQLRTLLDAQRVAALGTIGDDGAALVSMVPYALERQLGSLVIHVSGLAAHTGNLQARPRVSLLVMQAERPGEPVHALPRVTFDGLARVLQRDSAAWQACRSAYLLRFPEAEPMTQLGDFRFVAIEAEGARQVAGFGAARSLGSAEVRLVLTGRDA